MTDYINDYISKQTAQEVVKEAIRVVSVYPHDKLPSEEAVDIFEKSMRYIAEAPAADVRENVIAKKNVGGGEHDGATCWFECSRCGVSVDIDDKYCKHCGAEFVDAHNCFNETRQLSKNAEID